MKRGSKYVESLRQQTSGENNEYSAVLTTGKEDPNEQPHNSGIAALQSLLRLPRHRVR